MKRDWRRHCAVLVAWLGLFSLTATIGWAQDVGANGLELVELSGKLEAIAGNGMKVKTKDNQEQMVVVAGQTTFSYSGTADPKFLQPGLMVRFAAAFDQHGVAQAPLTTLEVFRPAKVRRMTPDVMMSQTPGIYPVTEGEKAGKEKTGKDKTLPPAPSGSQNYQVVGQLRAFQANKIQVAAGPRVIMVEISPDLAITVSSGDPFFCQPGDEIEISGLKNSSGLIQAETIQVKGAAPLGAGEGKPLGRNARTRGGTTTRGKLGDKDSGSPAEDGKKPKP